MSEALQPTSSAETDSYKESLLYQALTHPRFLRGIKALSSYTQREGMEGGLAAYSSEAGEIVVSKPDLPTPMEAKERSRSEYKPVEYSFTAGYENYSARNLLFAPRESEDSPHMLRTDVLMFIHSHPREDVGSEGRAVYSAKEMLVPSDRDLESFEELNRSSPGTCNGILVVNGSLTELFLYRMSQTKDYMQYHKALGEYPHRLKLIEAMNRGGINTAELTIGDEEEAYELQVEKAVAALMQ